MAKMTSNHYYGSVEQGREARKPKFKDSGKEVSKLIEKEKVKYLRDRLCIDIAGDSALSEDKAEAIKKAMEEDYESYLNDIKNESDSYFDSRYMQEITEFLCKNNILDIDYDDILEYLSDKETSLQDFISENDDISLLRKIESYSNIKRYFDEFEDNEDEYKEKWIENAIDGYENEAEWVIFNFGKDAIAGFVEHGLLEYDMEGICNYIEQFDGRGPTLASYDGEERESSDGYYIYRTN